MKNENHTDNRSPMALKALLRHLEFGFDLSSPGRKHD